MNKVKLEVVKQEMASMNIGFQESANENGLEWVNLTQMTIISTTVGKNPLEEMEQQSQSTRVQNVALGCNLKNDRMISVCFQGKPFIITVIPVYAPTSNAEESEVEQFYEDLQDLLELTTTTKDVLSIIGFWNAKVGSQDTWSYRKVWCWSAK